VKTISPKAAEKLGLLQEANRRFFHPLGFELVATDDGKFELQDRRGEAGGPKLATVDPDKIAALKRLSDLRKSPRQSARGFWIQPAVKPKQESQVSKAKGILDRMGEDQAARDKFNAQFTADELAQLRKLKAQRDAIDDLDSPKRKSIVAQMAAIGKKAKARNEASGDNSEKFPDKLNKLRDKESMASLSKQLNDEKAKLAAMTKDAKSSDNAKMYAGVNDPRYKRAYQAVQDRIEAIHTKMNNLRDAAK